jgi:hypothetical protein
MLRLTNVQANLQSLCPHVTVDMRFEVGHGAAESRLVETCGIAKSASSMFEARRTNSSICKLRHLTSVLVLLPL